MPSAVSIPHATRDQTNSFPAGSPMSFKAAMSLSRSFRAAYSPAMSIGADNSDYKISTSMTGSVESESSRLMKALSASQPRSANTLGDYLHPTAGEAEFCRDFTCCGIMLNDLHALVEHFEDAHVRVVPSEFPYGAPSNPYNFGPNGGVPPMPAGFDPDAMEMDQPELSSTPPPSAQHMQPPASAFDTTSVFLPYRRASDLGPAAYYNPGPSVLPRSHSTNLGSIHLNTAGIKPQLLTRTPEDTPPQTPTAKGHAPRRSINGPIVPNAATDPRPPLPGGKPFRCPTPNCTKSYKQANGLKYHLTHGQCSFLPPDPVLETLTDKEADERLRPFVCAVGANPGGKGGGCGRRYKNMNGLRYHYQHSGAHGAAGLTMLASNTHPPPPAWAVGGPTRSSSKGRDDSPTTPLGSRPGSSAGLYIGLNPQATLMEEELDVEDLEMEFDMA